ncbi:DUF4192 domain-containing protein [Streptomyces sp. AJS327]|uniref:DUF4192 domain-containing protein n=1 Tax=Streptomyces sp. AJS327 TaxID=2545265 RepID=UPI0015DE0694|nr:DUF4192 domain-containing protein [Streptomyces sp. AJS327]MBA0051975.1 DUF4192 domain-containing protein [Streptomyces sp. AJS327]
MTQHSDNQPNNQPTAEYGAGNQPGAEQPAACGDGERTAASVSVGREILVRGPGDLAEALPYLLGFQPDDSLVVIALHGERGRFGGRVRLGIPKDPAEWSAVAAEVALCLEVNATAPGEKPDGAVLFLCQDPRPGEDGADVMQRLRPLAQLLRTACGERDTPVYEALCLSAGRFWSYCCPDPERCPTEGGRLSPPGTSAMALAFDDPATPRSLRVMERRLSPLTSSLAEEQRRALDTAVAELVPQMLGAEGPRELREKTRELVAGVVTRFRRECDAPATQAAADARDDALLSHEEAATLIIGLQDRKARDQAAEWGDDRDAEPALRVWRALARRCVDPYAAQAAAPLTLAGWVAWASGDEAAARVALGRALRVDPEYLFARLLHQACNEGLDPERVRHCLREERRTRETADPETH